MGDPIGEHPGLARAGPRHYQDRPLGSRYRLSLRRIELSEQGGIDQEVILKPLRVHSPIVNPKGVILFLRKNRTVFRSGFTQE